MTPTFSPRRLLEALRDPEALLREMCRSPIAPGSTGVRPILDRQAIERLLPHRDPFLLVDVVHRWERGDGVIAASYDLDHASAVLAGHFPGWPVWPGVLQVEAIAQAGCLLSALQRDEALTEVAATHIRGARFVRPITPGAPVEIVVTGIEEGLFYTVIGQCLQRGEVCSAAVLSAYIP